MATGLQHPGHIPPFFTMAQNKDLLLAGMLERTHAFCGPESVQLDINSNCNNTCIGCWNYSPLLGDGKLKSTAALSLEKITELLCQFKAMGVENIQISGQGDPLLHPDIDEIIKRIKQHGFCLNLVTSFFAANEKTVKTIAQNNTDLLTVSLWAGDAPTYTSTHPGKTGNDFERITQNLLLLDALKGENPYPKVKHYHVVCRQNCGAMEGMLDFAVKTRADFIEFQQIDTICGKTDQLDLDTESKNTVKNQIERIINSSSCPVHTDKTSTQKLAELETLEFGRFVLGPRNMDINFAAEPENFTTSLAKKHFTAADFVLSTTTETQGGRTFLKRVLTCPALKQTHPRFDNPAINEQQKTMCFTFEKTQCATCALAPRCNPGQNGKTLVLRYLTLAGLGTFYRKVFGDKTGAENFFKNIPCRAGWAFSRILADGSVIPCCKADGFGAGNVNTTDFETIWYSKKMDTFRNKGATSPKTDPFFATMNCMESCDNAGLNAHFENQINALSDFEKNRLLELAKNPQATNLPAPGLEPISAEPTANNADGFECSLTTPQAANWTLKLAYTSKTATTLTVTTNNTTIAADIAIAPLQTGKALKQITNVYLPKGQHQLVLRFSPANTQPARLELAPTGNDAKVKQQLAACNEDLYAGTSTFRILVENFKKFGFAFTAKKLARYVLSGSMLSTWLDIAGMYSGSFAVKGPTMVQIDLTFDCTNNCVACWMHSPLLEEQKMPDEHKKTYLPTKRVKQLVDELYRMRTREILLAGGGEPFMHPDLLEIINYIKAKKMICSLNTSLVQASTEQVKQLAKSGVDNITVSVWAATESTYAKTHPGTKPGTLEQVKQKLLLLNSTKQTLPAVKICNVIFNQNCDEIEQMVEFARQSGVQAVEFTPADPVDDKTDSLMLSPEQQKRTRETFSRMCEKMGSSWKKDVVLFRPQQFLRRLGGTTQTGTYDQDIIGKVPCAIGWLFARVNADGQVNFCLKSHKTPTGNILEQSFSAIWNGKKQRELRKLALNMHKTEKHMPMIGNTQGDENGCIKSCDDLGRLVHFNQKVLSLSSPEKLALKAAGKAIAVFAALKKG